MAEPDLAARWQAYRRSRDPRLREQLIEQHLVLVKYVAARVAGRLPRHLVIDDLYSAGLVGFLRAIEDYDPDTGVQFAAYATPRVRGAIFDDLRRLDWVPRAARRRIREAEQAMATLAQRLGRAPTDEEVAATLGLSVARYHQVLADGITLTSLDGPAGAGEDEPLGERLEDASVPDPVAVLTSEERRRLLGRLIEGLPEKERLVLALYYHEGLTMRQVGEVLSVTESRVSQLHSSAVLRLRAALRQERLGAEDLLVPARGEAPRSRAR
jgi:RNA polymerase sigma factor for flagellar operon FliA